MNGFRKRCAEYRSWKKGYYHMASDGWQEGKLFHRHDQFVFGMATIGLIKLKYRLGIHAFILMPNHFHIVLSGNGNDCVDAFNYFRKRTSNRLIKDGYPPLPPDYGFKLIPIEDERQMRNHLLYVLRNAYEKQWCTPLGYLWSSGWLLFSQLASFIKGNKAETLSGRAVRTLIGSETVVPGHWEFHPDLGLLPGNFVDTQLTKKLFPNVKSFVTQLVKDYESYAEIARELNDEQAFSSEEVLDIVNLLIKQFFGNKELKQLTTEQKYFLAARLNQTYNIPPETISQTLFIPIKIVRQVLHSKEYGLRPDFQPLSPRPSR